MFKFHKYLTAALALVILSIGGATIAAIIKFGTGIITQPLATLIGVVVVPSIALFGFLMQKRIERSYEVSKEARNAAREFIDASTAYLTALMQSDFGRQIEKFQAYQSNWFQLHTVMPEVFSGQNKKILQYHYDALTAIQTARNDERRGEVLEEADMRRLLMTVRDSEVAMVSALTHVCTGIEVSKEETRDLIEVISKSQTYRQRWSRGNVAIQMGAYLTDREALVDFRESIGQAKAWISEVERPEREKEEFTRNLPKSGGDEDPK